MSQDLEAQGQPEPDEGTADCRGEAHWTVMTGIPNPVPPSPLAMAVAMGLVGLGEDLGVPPIRQPDGRRLCGTRWSKVRRKPTLS